VIKKIIIVGSVNSVIDPPSVCSANLPGSYFVYKRRSQDEVALEHSGRAGGRGEM
jgi:hypothetical protein